MQYHSKVWAKYDLLKQKVFTFIQQECIKLIEVTAILNCNNISQITYIDFFL